MGTWTLSSAFLADWQRPEGEIGGFQQRNLTQWGISRSARHRGQLGDGAVIQGRAELLFDGHSRLLRGLVTVERVVVVLVILAGLVQFFRLGAHVAERAGFLFFLCILGLGIRKCRARNNSEKQNKPWNYEFHLCYILLRTM